MSHLQTGSPSWPTYPPGPPRRRSGQALLIAMAVVVCLAVIAVGVITVLNRKHLAGRSGANPGSQPPPTAVLPVRTKLYGKPTSACSLIGSTTLGSVYPGATGEENDQDTPELENNYYTRECRFSAGGKGDFGLRFMTVRLNVTTGQDALGIITGTYPGFVAHLPQSVNIRQIEGQRAVRGYGDEAHLIYGIDSENCRSAFLLIRTQNATMTIQYGGCNNAGHLNLQAIDQTTTLNGVYTVAHEAMSHLIADN